jgi:hypothetical protein
MDKREIRISIFYSDLGVFDFLRLGHRQEQFLKSANEFYGKYNLRIDSFPFSYKYVLYRDAFVLSEAQGIKPDIGQDQLAADMRAHDANEKRLQTELPNTSQERRQQIAKELKTLSDQIPLFVWQGFNHTGEYDFRMALGERFQTNKTLKKHAPDWKKAPRLVVVFCEFIKLDTPSKTRVDVEAQGIFERLDAAKLTAYKQSNKPIPKFQDPLIIIDVNQANWHTLAHEIAHGNGHVHPGGEYGGYQDGPQESIYNYFSHDMPPSKVILEERDLKSLELAYFVRE